VVRTGCWTFVYVVVVVVVVGCDMERWVCAGLGCCHD